MHYETRFTCFPSQKQTLLQLCDIHVPEVQKILFSRSTVVNATPVKTSGWFTDETMKKIRAAMKEHLTTLVEAGGDPRQGNAPPVPPYEELITRVGRE